jgi:hypothetical protein
LRVYQWLFLLFFILAFSKVHAQTISKRDSAKVHLHLFSGKEPIDIIDIGRHIFNPHLGLRKDSSLDRTGKILGSVLPSAQYTLQTGFEVLIVGNGAFYTSNDSDANISNIEMSVEYSEKHQLFVPLEGNIWTKGNRYNILTDWKYEQFPQDTYGLGGNTTKEDGYLIDYSNVRFYQTLLKTVAHDLYLGLGYDLDYYWNIKEINPPSPTDFEKYGISPTSVSSGITLSVLYDSRRNSINPQPGYYGNIVYRPNFTFLGSDANWQSLLVDLRKYMNFPTTSKNILAFWSYNWFTLGGKPPYLNLISTAGDEYENMGRGYIQGRYRGQNLLYLESEYRFGITSNGLLGAVIFANVQSYTEPGNDRFDTALPGYGAGLRIKLNKFSKTNIALDYGFGIHGSQGIFANLGEVF